MPFPISNEQIATTEERTGVLFPAIFKARMARENGGTLVAMSDFWQLVPFLDLSDQKRMSRSCNDIVRETNAMALWHGFPEGAFVVAQNGTGDCLILQLTAAASKELGEEIHFWNHETREVEVIADSVDELHAPG